MLFGIHQLSAQECVLQLTGHVEDPDTKEKLTAATVTIKEIDRSLVTNDRGDFVFDNLCPASYTVIISHIGCQTTERTVLLKKSVHIDVYLPHEKNTLAEVTTASTAGVANTGFKKELAGKALEETKGLSLSEALSKINGVSLLQTGTNISKPIIHGLHSNRILTINNGVRQEGQQWGNEHAPEIDPFIADRLTVIKGVDELKYGSDAIGGVILVETKALRNKPGYAAEINTGYFTNNRQYVLSAVFEKQLKDQPAFRYRLQGTFKKGANAATPGYRLNNTASEEQNFSITMGWKKELFNTELFYSQFATKAGIFTGSHIGNLTDLQNAIAANKPSEVFLGENSYRIQRPRQEVLHRLFKSKSFLQVGEHRFNLLLSGQYNQRREFDVVRSSTNNDPQLDLSILTLSQDLNWEHPRKNNFSGVVGLASMQQDNTYSGRYFIPNYRSYTIGGYAIEKWSHKKWDLQAGIRYDDKNIQTSRLKFNSSEINYDFHFSTLAASFNAGHRFNNHWRANINTSIASRAPHVNELLSDGIHHGTATYELGDIFLNTEKSFNIAAGVSYQNAANTFSVDLNIYRNRIRDFIYQQPVPDSPVLTIAGAFPKIVYRQTNALLQGIDAAMRWQLFPSLEWSFKYSMLRARNQQTNDWLIWMPADRFNHELTFSFKEHKVFHKSYISAELQQVLSQSRVPSDKLGKQDYKAAPAGYTLVNLQASSEIEIAKVPVTVSVGVRNLLNTVYRDYLNSFRYFSDEMGRNISLRLKIPFSHL